MVSIEIEPDAELILKTLMKEQELKDCSEAVRFLYNHCVLLKAALHQAESGH